MRVNGFIFALLSAAIAASFAVPIGSAATPQQIYRDFADNGKLDGHYSRADVHKALRNLSVQGYGSPSVKSGLKGALGSKPAKPKASPGSQVVAATTQRSGSLPFTGLDLGLFAVGGAVLLLLGPLFRRSARERR